MLEDVLGRLSRIDEKVTVRTAFGEPVHENGCTIIPVARVTYGFGFGGGRNSGNNKEASDEGAGGGAGASVRPLAFLEIGGGKTRIRPILDFTRLALAGMALVAWITFWITVTIRARAKGND